MEQACSTPARPSGITRSAQTLSWILIELAHMYGDTIHGCGAYVYGSPLNLFITEP